MLSKRKFSPLIGLVVLISTSAAIVVTMMSVSSQSPLQVSAAFPSRTQFIQRAASQKDLLDCATYNLSDATPILPSEQTFFKIYNDIKVTPSDGKSYTAAFWSPEVTK